MRAAQGRLSAALLLLGARGSAQAVPFNTVPLDRAFSVKLYASSGVSDRTGNSFDLLGIALQYRWYDGTH